MKKNLYLLLISTMMLVSSNGQCLAKGNKSFFDIASQVEIYNVKDFGATGDSVTMDTKAIQRAIEVCNEKGGGMVWVPAGNYHIGTIRLKSNVTLSLDYGASLLGSTDIDDYVTDNMIDAREGNDHCLIYADNAINIAIEGLGVIDGRGTAEIFPRGSVKKRNARPRLMRMEKCDNVRLSGVTYKRPAFWGLHLVDCKNIHIDAIKIHFRNNNYNNDGLDLDGCEEVLIENCDINAGDDAICLKSSLNPCKNFVIRNCKVTSNTAPLKFGTSSRGGFINVKVYNCYLYDSPMGGIKLQLVDGGKLENIDISRIVMKNVGNPIFLRLGNRGRSYTNFVHQVQDKNAKNEGVPVGTFKNVRISNIVAEVTAEDPEKEAEAVYKAKDLKNQDSEKLAEKQKARTGPIMIAGIPGHYIEDVTFENIEISYPGGGTEADAAREISEDIARYPEQFFFGTLPSWGAYIRHAKNIQFKNVKLSTRTSDKREKIMLDDVEGFENN